MGDPTRDLMKDVEELVEALTRGVRSTVRPRAPVEGLSWECLAGEGIVILRGSEGNGAPPIEIRLKPDEALTLSKKMARMAKAAGEA